MTRDPVSWLLIERGWAVYDAHGKKIGKVEDVLGDDRTGIFHGIQVNGEEVLADRVAVIHEGDIRLS